MNPIGTSLNGKIVSAAIAVVFVATLFAGSVSNETTEDIVVLADQFDENLNTQEELNTEEEQPEVIIEEEPVIEPEEDPVIEPEEELPIEPEDDPPVEPEDDPPVEPEDDPPIEPQDEPPLPDINAAPVADAGPAGLTEQWRARFDGSDNGYDYLYGVAVDLSGNVFVTGYGYTSSGSSYDYVTVKFDPSGNQVWAREYDGGSTDYARSVVTDSAGNVIVTGYSYRSGDYYDYMTIKYDTNGNQQWAKRYNGNGDYYDYARNVGVDAADNVYVGGYSRYGTSYYDFVVVKYDANGNQKWAKNHRTSKGYYHYSYEGCMEVDAAGNVYLAGYARETNNYYDFIVVKWDTNGNKKWAKNYNSPKNYYDYARGLDIDSAGNVYVTGYARWTNNYYDYVVVKWDTNGNQKWAKNYNGPKNYYEYARDIEVDAGGNVWVSGYGRWTNNYYDYILVKWDTNGNQQWAKNFNGALNYYDYTYERDLAVDSSGNAYLTGYGRHTNNYYDFQTVAFDSAGNQKWVMTYNGPYNQYDYARGIAVDSVGNVYVAGYSYGGTNTRYDYVVIKYSSAYTGDEGSPITLDGSASYDPDGDPLQYRWDFDNDGTWDTSWSTSPTAGHIWGDDYSGKLALEVTDGTSSSTDTSSVTVANVAPSITPFGPISADEASLFTASTTAGDPGSDDLTFVWEFELGPTMLSIYFNGVGPDPMPSPGGTYPFSATDSVSHTYGDDGDLDLVLTVTDDDGGVATYTATVEVDNVAPTIGPFGPFTGDEGLPSDFTAVASDVGSDDLTFEWAYELGQTIDNTHYNDGAATDPDPSPGGNWPFTATDMVSHTYGDDGVFQLILTVTDDDGGSARSVTTVTVDNLDPTLDVKAYIYIDFTLRVSGEKWHNVELFLFDDLGNLVGYAEVWRMPGDPDDQSVTLLDYQLDIQKASGAVVEYTPFDDPINGQWTGADPAKVIVGFDDGGEVEFSHNFNVNHPERWVWNLGGINQYLAGHEMFFEGMAVDPGSDDLTFTSTWGDGSPVEVSTYYNDNGHPDPLKSPSGVYPFVAIDIKGHTYTSSGIYNLELLVVDDDGGSAQVLITIILQ
jgi:uncharacterized delta-60 repeat protein